MTQRIQKNPGKRPRISSPALLLILSSLSIIAIALTATYEYRSRKRDYFTLMQRQSELFINSLTTSTRNAISAAETIERELNRRILSNIRMVEIQDQKSPLTRADLDKYLPVIDVMTLHIYDSAGILLAASGGGAAEPFLTAFIQSSHAQVDTVITLIDYDNPENDRLAALIRRKRGGLIAGFIDRTQNRALKQSLGIGYLLKRFQNEENIEYVVIQNSQTIAAGSFQGYELSSFSRDPFLDAVQHSGKIQSRIIPYEAGLVFEAVSPFELYGAPYGILRLGLSMVEYESLQKDIQRRLLMVIGVIAIFGLIFIHFMINYRRRRYLHRDLNQLRDYTNSILENLSTGVISVNASGRIQTMNRRAMELLELDPVNTIMPDHHILPSVCQRLIKEALGSVPGSVKSAREWITDSEGHRHHLTFTANCLQGEDGPNTCILLCDDITDQTLLEYQVKRNQRLTAMRNLAMSVAHEIKNPLNAIQLLIDLIRKKYAPSPASGQAAFLKNITTVRSEIDRISTIVDEYLHLSRPLSLHSAPVDLRVLAEEIAQLFESVFKEKKIKLKVNMQAHSPLLADSNLLKQVFINLLKNAEEAIDGSGRIEITGNPSNDYYTIQISDTGRGIPEDDLNTLFDLHFTTKEKGSGIGLSVAQQIISAHQGLIDVTSEAGKGSTVIIKLPLDTH